MTKFIAQHQKSSFWHSSWLLLVSVSPNRADHILSFARWQPWIRTLWILNEVWQIDWTCEKSMSVPNISWAINEEYHSSHLKSIRTALQWSAQLHLFLDPDKPESELRRTPHKDPEAFLNTPFSNYFSITLNIPLEPNIVNYPPFWSRSAS